MVDVTYQEGITEVLDILAHMDKSYTEKIPKKFRDFLDKNQSKTYKPQLDHTKKLQDMNLKEKTKDILAIIYQNYWCNETEKKAFQKKLKENQIKHDEEMREKYNPDNLFKESKQKFEVQENRIEIQEAMLTYKESKWKKIVDKIKNVFQIK